MPVGSASLRIGLIVSLLITGTVYAVPQLEMAEVVATSGVVKSIDVSPDGDYVVAGTEEGNVYFINGSWELSWKEKLYSSILSIAVSSSGEFVVAGDNSRVYLFNKTGGLLWGDRGRLIGGKVKDVDISTQGDYVVAGSSNNFIYLFDRDGKLWWKNLGSTVQGVGISPSGEYIAAGTSEGEVYLFKMSGELVWQHSLGKFISDVAVWEQNVVVASRFIHSISAGEVTWSYDTYLETKDVGFSSTGEFVVVGSGDDIYILNDKEEVLFEYSSEEILGDVAISDVDNVAVGAGKEVRLLTLPDTTAPEVRITNPVNGSKISGLISITASTNEPSLKSLQVIIDDNYACGALPCKWDTSASTQGKHTIALIAEDESGNKGEDSVEVFIEGSEFELVEKAEDIMEDLKDELSSGVEDELSSGVEDELSSGEDRVVSPPVVKGRRRGINVEISRWTIGAFLFVPAAAYLYGRRNKKGYRWNGKKRRR